jgi:hypothetical protein
MKLKTIFALLVIIAGVLAAEDGYIKGQVRDGATQRPLVGVNVIVVGTDRGAATDERGEFVIPDLAPGFYHVRFEMIGYEPLVKMNIRVTPTRGAYVTAELVQQPVELAGVTVTRAYYEKGKDAVVSSRTVDLAEIRRDPAGAIDIQRMMQALPSVVSAADQMNEIVVRGGSPGENLFVMDNIEIANPNHFGVQGTGGGPVNMVNTLFIDRVDFLAGAFPAKFGDKASSVMEIRLREGNRDFHSLDLDMSMAGIGFFAEGPLWRGRGSYMASYRKSYLDLIIKQTGLTAVPHYWNAQAKVVYRLNSTDKLAVNYLHGQDWIEIVGESTPQTRGAENVVARGSQTAAGVTYTHLWHREGMTRLAFAGTNARFDYDVFRYTARGDKQTYYRQDELEWDFQLRGDFVWRLSPHLELSGGGDLKRLGLNYDAWLDRDTLWVHAYSLPTAPDSFLIIDRNTWQAQVFPVIAGADPDSIYLDEQNIWHYGRKRSDGLWEQVRVKQLFIAEVQDSWELEQREAFNRYSGFFQVKWKPGPRLTFTTGLHLGYFAYTRFGWVSPRLGVSYRLTDRSSLNLAFGRHYQSPPRVILTYNPANHRLRSKYTNQVVFGLEHFFTEDTRGTVEVYWKGYHDLPVSLAATTLDTADESFQFVNRGEGKSYGVEFFLQKKLVKDLFGTFSYSWYRAFMRDVRYPQERKYYPWDFDFQHVLTAICGYKIPLKGRGVKPLGERSWLVRLLGYSIGYGAEELEFSLRYRYVGGKPYTPQVYNHYVRRWYERRGGDRNGERFPPYHRFDLMILWHVNLGKRMALVSYFDLQNVFDRDNIWDLQRNADGTTEYVYQFKVFPVGGFTLEF